MPVTQLMMTNSTADTDKQAKRDRDSLYRKLRAQGKKVRRWIRYPIGTDDRTQYIVDVITERHSFWYEPPGE